MPLKYVQFLLKYTNFSDLKLFTKRHKFQVEFWAKAYAF